MRYVLLVVDYEQTLFFLLSSSIAENDIVKAGAREKQETREPETKNNSLFFFSAPAFALSFSRPD